MNKERVDTPDSPESRNSEVRRLAQLVLDEIKRCEAAHYYNPNRELKPLVEWVLEQTSAPSETRPRVKGVDVPHAWPEEAIKGPRSEPEALVAWLATAKDLGAERTIEVMKKRLARLEELRP